MIFSILKIRWACFDYAIDVEFNYIEAFFSGRKRWKKCEIVTSHLTKSKFVIFLGWKRSAVWFMTSILSKRCRSTKVETFSFINEYFCSFFRFYAYFLMDKYRTSWEILSKRLFSSIYQWRSCIGDSFFDWDYLFFGKIWYASHKSSDNETNLIISGVVWTMRIQFQWFQVKLQAFKSV